MYFGDIVIRIDEELDEVQIRDLELGLSAQEGVYQANIQVNRRHLLIVDFDPDQVQPNQIVQSVRARGLHAEMIVR